MLYIEMFQTEVIDVKEICTLWQILLHRTNFSQI